MCTPVSDFLKIVSANSNPQPHYMPAFTEMSHTSSQMIYDFIDCKPNYVRRFMISLTANRIVF
jgi:hypothetical protein